MRDRARFWPVTIALCSAAALAALGVGSRSTRGGNTATRAEKPAEPRETPQRLIEEVVANESSAEQADQSLWRFQRTTREGPKQFAYEVVDTPQGQLQRLVAENGQPVDAEQGRREDSRIEGLIGHPEDLQKIAEKEQADEREESRLLKMLPIAFQYNYAEASDASSDASLVKLTFTPNPTFRPQRREGEVFHHMQGAIWVDPSQKRIARIRGRLVSEVLFGDGLLGHLATGGTFDLEQKDVGAGRWELARLDVNMVGRVLFFKNIRVQQEQQDSDFQPVSPSVSLQQAAGILKLESGQQPPLFQTPASSPSESKGGPEKTEQRSNSAQPRRVVFPKNMSNFAEWIWFY